MESVFLEMMKEGGDPFIATLGFILCLFVFCVKMMFMIAAINAFMKYSGKD